MVTRDGSDRRSAAVHLPARHRIELDRIQFAHDFGVAVRTARASRGWSVPSLARRAALSRAEIDAIESGLPMPGTVLARVAATLGIAVP
ncbi:helix-turn-helix domain-containing protein [Nocardia sp. NPDC052001]|uniref:helix-turn-helix domain-containing protein n=1 Tax=Nocardia sp. NPDC052001 TaxID=3154853 RepID=UPI00343BC7C9